MIQHRSAVMSVQVEIAVVCHINDCILVRHCLVMDGKRIVIIQGVRHMHIQGSRIPLVTVRAVEQKRDMSGIIFLHFPETFVIIIRAAVEAVFPIVVFRQVIVHAVQVKPCPADAVGAPSYHSPNGSIAFFISCRIPVSEYHVAHLPLFVRDEKIHQDRAVI